ncbi:MAG: hypothetical protein AAF711_06690 [Planctomycetota bacterium]
MKRVAIPLLIIAIGLGWLLTSQGVLPCVNWVWVMALAGFGIVIPAWFGLDRGSIVLGPFLVSAALLSLLRQSELITLDTQLPLLVIVFGVQLMIAMVLPLRTPRWLYDPPVNRQGSVS